MTAKLSKALSNALSGHDQIEAIDPATGRLFILTEKSLYELSYQQQVNAAIQRGIEDMEAGRTMTIDESRRRSDEALDRFRQ
jgi:predicted transcriptional regulator